MGEAHHLTADGRWPMADRRCYPDRVDVDPMLLSGRQLCEALMQRGVLAKDTHGSTIRLAPPLVATEEDITYLVDAIRASLAEAAEREHEDLG